MSLINDAIKQANKASKQKAFTAAQPASAPAAAPTSFQVAPRPESQSPIYLIGGVVVFILLGGLFLALASRSGEAPRPEIAAGARETTPSTVTATASAPIATAPVIEPAVPEPVAVAGPVDASIPATPVTTKSAPVLSAESAAPAPEPVVESVPERVLDPVPTEFPELKLQGIYYRLNNPSVMINGKTLERGDYLTDHVRVVQIERRSVLVEMNGQTRLLRMN